MSISFAAASLVERVGWLLVHSVWQFALIAIILAMVLRIMRRASAETRYAIALAGWGLMLAAPAATWLLLPSPDAGAQFTPGADVATADPPQAPAPVAPFETAAVDSLAVSPVDPLVAPAPTPSAFNVNAVTAPPVWTETLAARIAPWLNTLVVVWCIGVCALGAWSAAGWVGVRRLLRRDVMSVPDELTTLLVSVLRRVGLNQRVRLLQSPHVEVPLVVGWLRPVILLPACVVTGFPPAQLEAVLAHELAHIRRHDYVINLLQLLSETVFFYHPALWWVSGVVRREREHCCDELAAQALGNRAEYGRALVALEELRGRTPSLALGAKGGSLLERIQRLAQRESSPQWSAEGVIEVAVIVAVVLTAAAWTAVDAGGDADDDSPAAVNAESAADRDAATFSFGGRVEVMALGTHDEEPQQWWDAGGQVLESVPFAWSSDSKLTVTPKFGYRRVVFQVHDLPADAHVQWKASGSGLAMGGRVTLSDGTTPRNVFTRYFSVDQAGETFDLRVGVATGPWKSVVSMTGAGAKTVNGVNLLLTAPVETETETSVVVTHNVLNRDYRMVAIDTGGEVHNQLGYGGYSSNGVVQATARFANLERKEIERFEFQLREYEWVTINDLPLQPVKVVAATALPLRDAAEERVAWLDLILEQTNGNRTQYSVGPRMICALSADEAFEVTRQAWPQLQAPPSAPMRTDEVKRGLMQAFDSWTHVRVLDVLDLGATDSSRSVREAAFDSLRHYAFRDFSDPGHNYAAWRTSCAGRPANVVLRENAVWFVTDLKNRMPADDELWWLNLRTLLDFGPSAGRNGRHSTDFERAESLRDAGLIDVLQALAGNPGSGLQVKIGSLTIISDLHDILAAAKQQLGDADNRNTSASALQEVIDETRQKHSQRAAWLGRLSHLREFEQTHLGAGPWLIAELSPDTAFETIRTAWPHLPYEDVKFGLLYAFVEASHPRVLDVLDLGATDPSVRIRESAFSNLKDFAFRNFSDPQHSYAEWRKTFAGQPVPEVMQASCKSFVQSLKAMPPVEDADWWSHLKRWTSQDYSDGDSSDPEKAAWFRDAGLIELLQGWARSNPDLKERVDYVIYGIEDAIEKGESKPKAAKPITITAAIPAQDAADEAATRASPIGAMSEVSVADQVSKYAFEADIPADHYLWITPTEVPQRRGYSQANIRLQKEEPGTQRVELEFKYRDDQRGTSANPLLSTSDTILYGWSAPGCDRPGGTSIVGVPMFKTATEDKKIVLVDPSSDMAKSERGTRLLLIIPKDANPQTRAEVEAIQPRGEIVVLLEKIEPQTERPADQRLLGQWHAQRNSIGTSYIKYRRFRQGAGVLKALSPSQVAELFAPEGRLLTSDEAIAAAGGLLEKPESKLFGPDYGTSTFRSVGNKSLETSVRLGQPGDARYIDGEYDIRWDAGNRQAHLDKPGKSGYGWTTLQDFNLADRMASLRELDVTPITGQVSRVKSGPIDLVVDASGFVYSWQANLTERKFAKSTFQFEPQVPASDVILPRLRMDFDFSNDELQLADIVLIEEARVNEGFQPEDFALPLPAGSFFFDHRSEPERRRGRNIEEAVDDAAAFARRTFDAKVSSAKGDGDQSPADTVKAESPVAPADNRVRFTLIQAKHVLLLDGKQIVTWPEIDAKIAALPDPAQAYPQLYVTRGAMEAGLADAAQKEAYELHKKYKLGGHSIGSLTPRTDVHYDRVETAADLAPDPALRVEGRVVDAEGKPVAGAEVVLVTPVDESLSYKEYDIAIIEGRVRNPLDEILTVADAEGRFSVYPPKDTPFSVLALHPDVGIALVDGEQLRKEPKATLLKWGGIVAEFSQEPEEQSATLYTHLDATPTRPRISISQYWVDLQRPEKTLVFGFTRVPPIWQTTIMRSFPSDNGGMSSIPGAAVGPLPGETRSLSLGPVSEQQREFLKRIRERLKPRAQVAPADTDVLAQSATNESGGETASAVDPPANSAKVAADEAASTAAAAKRDEWIAKLLRLKNHNQTAFAIGPTMIFELPADDALAVTRAAWPQIKVDEVKTGLLKTFEFDRHPQVLEVLDLGATDGSEEVRKYACRYLKNYAFRDFSGDRKKYDAWWKTYAGRPTLEVIQENAGTFVRDLKTQTPVNEQAWWLELRMLLNVGGSKSSYLEKAVYLRDAGLVELLKEWADDPQAGPRVKAGTAELVQQIDDAVAKATAAEEGRPAVEGAARSGDRPQPES